MRRGPPRSTLFPYTTLFRSVPGRVNRRVHKGCLIEVRRGCDTRASASDRTILPHASAKVRVVVRKANGVDDAAAGAGAVDRQRRSGGEGENSGKLPVAHHRSQRHVPAGQFVTRAEGQLIDERGGGDMGVIDGAGPFFQEVLVWIAYAHQVVRSEE